MKISQLYNHNDIEFKVNNVIEDLSSRYGFTKDSSKVYYVPILNVIVSKSISLNYYLKLTSEYVYNVSLLKRIAYNMFRFFTFIMIKLGMPFGVKLLHFNLLQAYPSIVGGKNRLRFNNSLNTSSIVTPFLLNGCKSIKNCIDAYNSYNSYIGPIKLPFIYYSDSFIYVEEVINAIAFNRLPAREADMYKPLFSTQYMKMINLNAFEVSLDEYLNLKVGLHKYDINLDLTKISINSIPVTKCHGDLNRGNVFLSNTDFYIIDWETFSIGWLHYDLMVFDLNLRHISLNEYEVAISNLIKKNYEIGFLVLIEELNYYSNERYNDKIKTLKECLLSYDKV